MPRGYPRNGARKSMIEATRTDNAPTPPTPAEISPPAERTPPDLLTAANIPAPNLPQQAAAEELTGATAYQNNRVATLSRQANYAQILRIKIKAREKGYNLKSLVMDTDALQAAIDDFDITCFEAGVFPIQNLLAVWLNTTMVSLNALQAASDISPAGEIIAAHSDYCVSLISSSAFNSDKPPVFSIYYLKCAYRLYDNAPDQRQSGTTLVQGNITQNININAADISKKSQLFTEIDSKSD